MTKPSHSLQDIKDLIAAGKYMVTGSSKNGAFELGFDTEDICECICEDLAATHFYKTMASNTKAGAMQDVYKITYEEQRVYLKLEIDKETVWVISFKEDTSYEAKE